MNNKGFSYVWHQFALLIGILLVGILFLLAGLMIGYAVVGDGGSLFDVLNPSKWAEWVSKFTG